MEINLPLWLIILIMILYSIPFCLSGLGIYYLVIGKYNKTVLIASSLVFLIPIIFIAGSNFANPLGMFEEISKYFFYLSGFDDFSSLNSLIDSLMWRVMVYLSIFAIVNSVYLLFKMITSRK